MGSKLDEMADEYQRGLAKFIGRPEEQLKDLKRRYREGVRRFLQT